MIVNPSQTLGLLAGALGVVLFSLTLPMTKLAVSSFDAAWVALMRAEGAAVLAGVALALSKAPSLSATHRPGLIQVIVGVVIGFPLFTSLGMKFTDASHGALVVGLLPIATALAAALLNNERPSVTFWAAALAGTVLVCWHAVSISTSALGWGDGFLLVAVVFSSIGYAGGGKLAQSLGGWQTIACALVYAAPFLLIPAIWATWHQSQRIDYASVPWHHWAALAYLVVISQFLGFFAWYGGMALAGVARVSQLQLLQLFFTLGFSVWLLGESVSNLTWIVGLLVCGCVLVSKKARIN